MNIETTVGTMTGEAWHVGKLVALNPSGYNWRVENDDIDILIDALENQRNHIFIGYRLQVIVQRISGGYEIIASDTASYEYPIAKTHITDIGVRDLVQLLKSVQLRPDIRERNN